MNTYIGYRWEGLYGGGYRDLKGVVKHEIEQLGNEDILDTLNIKDIDALINDLYSKGYTKCIWLCQSKEKLIERYIIRSEFELDNLIEVVDSIDAYMIVDPFILSDLGDEGQLIAYKPENIQEV